MKSNKSKTTVFAVVDCDNFFAACERITQPQYTNRPTVVLSSNDGCIIARSQEVKAAGIPMGAPIFQYRDKLESLGVEIFSANFKLYRLFSDRIHKILKEDFSNVEQYSIDEYFIEINQEAVSDDLMQEVRRKIYAYTGITVSVGVGKTKTLAKSALYFAKRGNGVAVLNNREKTINLIKVLPVENVWGIGRRLAPKFKSSGINTAYELTLPRAMGLIDNKTVRQTCLELKGTQCFGMDNFPDERKTLAVTRSFGGSVSSYNELFASFSVFAAQAGAKLRARHQYATKIRIFTDGVKGSEFEDKTSFRSHYDHYFSEPTNDSLEITTTINGYLSQKVVFEKNTRFKRAGIILCDLLPAAQTALFTDHNKREKSQKLMGAVDSITSREGRNSIVTGGELLSQSWIPRAQYRSPFNFSDWSALPRVKTS